jgi:hypothetical protein
MHYIEAAAGFDRYLVKPADLAALRAVLASLAKEKRELGPG